MRRIQVGCIHFAYGLIITGRSLCLSHFEERQMGHIQRQQSCYLTKSTKGIRLLIFVSTTLIAPFFIQNNKMNEEKKQLSSVSIRYAFNNFSFRATNLLHLIELSI